MPDWNSGKMTPETARWIGKAGALVDLVSDWSDRSKFKTASAMMTDLMFELSARTIESIVHHALATAEIAAADSPEGVFLEAGKPFDAFVALSELISAATSSVRFVDAYGDSSLVARYVPLAGEEVAVEVLTSKRQRGHLEPAVTAWAIQYPERPLEVRFNETSSLHDRYIVVDRRELWKIGQSFNKLVERAATTIVREPTEVERKMLAEIDELWNKGMKL
ncbi:MAG: hypothetical protein Devi2KO_36710 [Devosia indica]